MSSWSQVIDTSENAEEIESYSRYKYPSMKKSQGAFSLSVTEGDFTDSQILVMLGENGTGKTTFIRMLVRETGEQSVDVDVCVCL